MKNILVLLVWCAATTASASVPVDFDFNQLTNCTSGFEYEKVFMFVGRSSSEVLVRDEDATEVARTLEFKKELEPVTEAYSTALYPNYINYRSLVGRVEKLALILTKAEQSSEAEFNLLLFVSQGPLKGLMLAQHPARFDTEKGEIHTKFFSCSKPEK